MRVFASIDIFPFLEAAAVTSSMPLVTPTQELHMTFVQHAFSVPVEKKGTVGWAANGT